MGVRGPVLLPLAVTLPASCSRCPSCSQELKRLTGQRAARQGDPAPRHQVPLHVPTAPSRRFTQRAQTGTPRPAWGDPTATSSHREALPRPDPRSSAPARRSSGTGQRRRGVSAQAGLTRRTAWSRSSRLAAGWASPPGTPAASCQLGPARARGVG